MKDGDQLSQDDAPMLRAISTIGCMYQTPQGERPAVLLTLQVGSKEAPTAIRIVVPAQGLQQVANALLQAHRQIEDRTTPSSGAKH